jgi:hypothetical protein
MVVELSYINTKSLQYMLPGDGFEPFFGVVGAIAFSVVTVLIMRLGKLDWLKIAFPLFDVALAFCGFNLNHANNLMDNPIRFALSVFLAGFAGFITYSLGQINAQQHEVDNSEVLKSKLEKTESDFGVTQTKLEELQSNYGLLSSNLSEIKGKFKVTLENEGLLQSNLTKLQSDFEVTSKKLEDTQKLLSETEAKAHTYEETYYSTQRARILKKAEKNRTPEDLLILEKTN